MRWGEQITLVALSEPSPRTNEHGFPVARTETATTVFADKKSVGFSEFYKAQQAGYTTELNSTCIPSSMRNSRSWNIPFRAGNGIASFGRTRTGTENLQS